jgi:hypothetical protein
MTASRTLHALSAWVDGRRAWRPVRRAASATRVLVGVVAGLLVLVDLGGVAIQIQLIVVGHHIDFAGYQTVTAALLHRGDIYASNSQGWIFYRWSPLAAYLLVPVVALGLWPWRLLHFAVLAALRDWRLVALVAVSWPFWADVEQGSVLTFCFVAAVLALRGSRTAGAVYLALCLLIPRPLMAPVALWLLWQHPRWRLPFLAAAAAQVGLLAAMGDLGAWVRVLAGSSSEMTSGANMGPSVVLGYWWPILGLPLAAWFTWRGRLGLASLAASPYWLLYYLLFGLLEFVRPGVPSDQPGGAAPIAGSLLRPGVP